MNKTKLNKKKKLNYYSLKKQSVKSYNEHVMEFVDFYIEEYGREDAIVNLENICKNSKEESLLVDVLFVIKNNLNLKKETNSEFINRMIKSEKIHDSDFDKIRSVLYNDHNFTKDAINSIYIIECSVNGHVYIGSTNNFNSRIITHKLLLKNNRHHNYKLQIDFNNYGESCFTYNTLWTSESKINRDELYLIEQIYLDKYNPEYNILKKCQKK